MEDVKGLETIVRYLFHPLVLIGLVLLIFFTIQKALIARSVIPPVGPRTGGRLAQTLLRHGSGVALVVILLGLGMAFYEGLLDARIQENVDALIGTVEVGRGREVDQPGRDVEDWKARAGKAVKALRKLADTENAPPDIDHALNLLAAGEHQAAEAAFQAIIQRGKPETKKRATVHRHLGGLPFVHDPDNALDANRRAAELESDNPARWNELGHLLTQLAWQAG